jgi:hypothetical protein
MTTQDELRGALVGRTVAEVKLDDQTGTPLAILRLSREGAEDAHVCFDASGFADADSIWRQLI